MKPLKFALLGAGRIGQVHARALASHDLADLAVVHDPFGDAAQSIATKYGCEISDIGAIAENPAIDGVLICTPTDTHADLIELFSQAGKAVFCEKPVDLNRARVEDCLKTVAKNSTKLMLGFNRRFDPHIGGVIDAVAAGKIGAVEQIIITSRDPGLPPKDYIAVSGGIFRDMMIHDFDIARVLLDEDIATVQATASALVDPSISALNDYDTANVMLTTTSGKLAVITNSRRASYGYDQRVEVHGSLGSVTAQNQRAIDIELATADGYQRPPLHDFFMTRYTDAYSKEITAFVNAIVGDTHPTPTGIDGLEALKLAEAALASLESGRAVAVS